MAQGAGGLGAKDHRRTESGGFRTLKMKDSPEVLGVEARTVNQEKVCQPSGPGTVKVKATRLQETTILRVQGQWVLKFGVHNNHLGYGKEIGKFPFIPILKLVP